MEDAPSTVEVEKYVKRAVYAVVILLAIVVGFVGYASISFVQWLSSK